MKILQIRDCPLWLEGRPFLLTSPPPVYIHCSEMQKHMKEQIEPIGTRVAVFAKPADDQGSKFVHVCKGCFEGFASVAVSETVLVRMEYCDVDNFRALGAVDKCWNVSDVICVMST